MKRKYQEVPLTPELLDEIAREGEVQVGVEVGFALPPALPAEEVADKMLLKQQVEQVLESLTPQEKRVLQLRFGLVDGRSRTLEEVGREFGVTREKIRQIEAKALRKLRRPRQRRLLK